MMVMVRRRGPHFGSPVSDLLRLTEANFEGVEMSEDGVTTVGSFLSAVGWGRG